VNTKRPPLAASLAPIYAALATLVAISVLGFVVALWPGDTGALPGRSEGAAAEAPPSRTFEGALRLPPGGREPGSRMKWL
jgi:hypothetical protein